MTDKFISIISELKHKNYNRRDAEAQRKLNCFNAPQAQYNNSASLRLCGEIFLFLFNKKGRILLNSTF